MATIRERIKSSIGRVNLLKQRAARPGPAQAAAQASMSQTAAAGSIDQDAPDQILESISFDVPAHARFLNTVKNVWRIIGPPTFVVFTAWEVFYYMSHFMAAVDIMSKILLWGITLLIEVPFMIATFDQAERKRVRAEKRAMGTPYQEEDTIPSIVMWSFLALVNVVGQVAFLLFITHLGDNPFDFHQSGVIGLWIFVCVRVAGVITGDSYTAFFLRPDETTIERTIRAENARGRGRIAIKENRAELKRIEAESNARIRHIDIAIRKEEREARFMEEWQNMNMSQTLARQQAYMKRELSGYKIEEIEGPGQDTEQLEGL